MQSNPLEDLIRKQQKAGQNQSGSVGVAAFLLLLGVFVGIPMFGWSVGGLFSLAMLWALISALKEQKRRQQAAQRAQQARAATAQAAVARPAARPAANPAPVQKAPAPAAKAAPAKPVRCDNPEPHRHFEAPKPQPQKPCDNREPHRHFDRDAMNAAYVQYAQERRRESVRALFDAGLLTREEYSDQLRRMG